MPLFALKSQSRTVTLANAQEDYKNARRLEQYRLGREAVYFLGFPGTWYIPFAAVGKTVCRNTGMPLKGCCGKELPVTKVRLYYDETSFQDFIFEKESNARRLLESVEARSE